MGVPGSVGSAPPVMPSRFGSGISDGIGRPSGIGKPSGTGILAGIGRFFRSLRRRSGRFRPVSSLSGTTMSGSDARTISAMSVGTDVMLVDWTLSSRELSVSVEATNGLATASAATAARTIEFFGRRCGKRISLIVVAAVVHPVRRSCSHAVLGSRVRLFGPGASKACNRSGVSETCDADVTYGAYVAN